MSDTTFDLKGCIEGAVIPDTAVKLGSTELVRDSDGDWYMGTYVITFPNESVAHVPISFVMFTKLRYLQMTLDIDLPILDVTDKQEVAMVQEMVDQLNADQRCMGMILFHGDETESSANLSLSLNIPVPVEQFQSRARMKTLCIQVGEAIVSLICSTASIAAEVEAVLRPSSEAKEQYFSRYH